MRNLVLCLLFPAFAHAGPYVELGIAKADGGTCIRDEKIENKQYVGLTYVYNYTESYMGCSKSPLGNIALGYAYKGFAAEIEHWSSLQEKDKGLNLFTIKYRYEFWK